MSEYQTPPPYARPVRSINPRIKRRKRRGLLLGGGGGGGSALDAAFPGGGGTEVGSAICTFAGGGGGVSGTFSGGMVLIELDVAGVDDSLPGETEATGPGGGGVAAVAV